MKFLGVAAILAIVATVSSAQDCVNNKGVFTYSGKKDGEPIEKRLTCRELSKESSGKQENKCRKNTIANNCPGLCDEDCDAPEFSCVNFDGKFKYISINKGELKMTCEKAGESNTEKRCGKIEIATNCPGTCDEDCADNENDIDNCSNFDVKFAYVNGSGDEKITSCEKLASLDPSKLPNKCKKKEIRKNCPGVCDSDCAEE